MYIVQCKCRPTCTRTRVCRNVGLFQDYLLSALADSRDKSVWALVWKTTGILIGLISEVFCLFVCHWSSPPFDTFYWPPLTYNFPISPSTSSCFYFIIFFFSSDLPRKPLFPSPTPFDIPLISPLPGPKPINFCKLLLPLTTPPSSFHFCKPVFCQVECFCDQIVLL